MGRGRSETARGARIKGVREIAATVVRLARGPNPPRIERIRALYPGVDHERVSEGYRIGCLDLVLKPGGKPILGDTQEERDAIKARIRELHAWKMAHPSCCGPARPAHHEKYPVRARKGM